MSKVAVIDCQVAGISGDMLVSALVDAGASPKRVRDAAMRCQEFLKGSTIQQLEFVKSESHGFSATKMELSCIDKTHERKASEMYRQLAACCDSIDMSQRAKVFAQNSMRSIISAEARIHGEKITQVHLHEASSIDTFVDIVGSAVGLDDLDLFGAEIYSTKVAVGNGVISFSHGKTPNPGPAVLEIFKGKQFTLEGANVGHELCTPTGAALLVNLAKGYTGYYPALKPEQIGYGKGTQDFKEFANVLRVVIGSAQAEMQRDSVVQIETNVDDVSGEIIGNMVDVLTAAGVKDVTVTSAIAKKNRPSSLIRIITDQERMNTVLEILFNESGSLGARVQQVERVLFPRSSLIIPVRVAGDSFSVNVKVVVDPSGKAKWAKPEFDDLKNIALKTKLPVKQISGIVNAQVAKATGLV